MSNLPFCRVNGCNSPATVKVFLHDEYQNPQDVFHEQDKHCPYLCDQHMQENELNAVGVREPRGVVEYPYTNQRHANGWSVYEAIGTN